MRAAHVTTAARRSRESFEWGGHEQKSPRRQVERTAASASAHCCCCSYVKRRRRWDTEAAPPSATAAAAVGVYISGMADGRRPRGRESLQRRKLSLSVSRELWCVGDDDARGHLSRTTTMMLWCGIIGFPWWWNMLCLVKLVTTRKVDGKEESLRLVSSSSWVDDGDGLLRTGRNEVRR